MQKGRKFWLAVAAEAIATAAMAVSWWTGSPATEKLAASYFVTFDQWTQFTQWLLGIYIAGNVTQKFSRNGQTTFQK